MSSLADLGRIKSNESGLHVWVMHMILPISPKQIVQEVVANCVLLFLL